MLPVVIVICATVFLCVLVVAIAVALHRRFLVGLDVTELVRTAGELKATKADLDAILNQAGEFSKDVSERLEAVRRDLVRTQNQIGIKP